MVNVLIVDDEQVVIDGYKSAIKNFNSLADADMQIQLTTSRDSESALKKLELTRFDVFIIDIDLPGKDGIELAEMIRNKHPHAPMIFQTSIDHEVVIEYAMTKIKALDYIKKPYPRARIISLLYDIIANINKSEDKHD